MGVKKEITPPEERKAILEDYFAGSDDEDIVSVSTSISFCHSVSGDELLLDSLCGSKDDVSIEQK